MVSILILIELLLPNLSQSALAHDACGPAFLRTMIGSHSHSGETEAEEFISAYEKNHQSADLPKLAQIFLRTLAQNPQKEMIAEPLAGATRIVESKRSGSMNAGVHFYSRDGYARVVKVLMAPNAETQSILSAALLTGEKITGEHLDSLTEQLILYAREIRNLKMAETSGGPKLMEIGVFRQKDQALPYLEMEWIGAGHQTFTAKDCAKGCLAKLSRMVRMGSRIPEDASDLLISLYERKILPVDPDFIYGKKMKIRWLDVGLWERYPTASQMAPRFADEVWRSLQVLTHYQTKDFLEGRHLGKRMLNRFLARTLNSAILSESEKKILILELGESPYASGAMQLFQIKTSFSDYAYSLAKK